MNLNSNKKSTLHGFRKAFTLVELTIVIVIIALFAIFTVPSFTNILGDTQITQVKSDTTNIKNVVTAYIQEVGAVPVANANTDTSKVLDQGISTSTFKEKAADNAYYAIDMDLLTKPQTNIDNPIEVMPAKLSIMPATSAIVDVSNKKASEVKANKTIKNTSVVYVIDKQLRVFAAYDKTIKKSTTTLPTSNREILNPADSHSDASETIHKTFKVPFKTGSVIATLSADDSNYK